MQCLLAAFLCESRYYTGHDGADDHLPVGFIPAFRFSDNRVLNTGVLMILLFVVMMFSLNHLVNGLFELFRGKNGIDALNLFSCLATSLRRLYHDHSGYECRRALLRRFRFSLTFTFWGEKLYYKTLTSR
jgi:hypothetical protein